MTISYCLLTQKVSLEMTPAELGELTDAMKENLREHFRHVVQDMKDLVGKVKEDIKDLKEKV